MVHILMLSQRASGNMIDTVHFFYVQVFNPMAQSPQKPTSIMPATEWAGEEESIWWADERSWAWHILPPCLFNLWSHGTHCNRGIQKDCLPHRWEVTTALQPDPVLAEMQAELLAPAPSHQMPQRCTLTHPSSSWTIRDWRAHRPDVLIESNLSPRLANETI